MRYMITGAGFCALLATTVAAAAPPETLETRGREQRETLASAPIYLYRDDRGLTFSMQIQKDDAGGYRLWKYYILPADLAMLRANGAIVDYLPYEESVGDDRVEQKSLNTCTTSTYPTGWNIYQQNGVVIGNVGVCQTNTRPPGTSTQVVDFEMFSSGYAGKGAHTPVVLWYKATLHGHGMYFGDSSAYGCSNGQPSTYNTRIEGWSQWYLPDPQQYPLGTPRWSSTELWLNDTCGAPLVDGWNVPLGIVSTKYRFNVHASSGQWVQYSVNRWNGSVWVTHTAPVVKNVTYANWTTPLGPGEFDPAANGVFIGSTASGGANPGWTIGIRNLNVSWF